MKKNAYSSDYEELIKMGKILIGIVAVLLSIYLLFGIFSGEIRLKKEEKEAKISYEEILGGSIATINKDDYYVLFYNFKDDDFGRYIQIAKNQGKNIYLVDLSKGFNNNNLAKDKSEENIKDINNLKVLNPTLIKVSKKKVDKSFDKESDIIKELLKSV